MIARCIPLSLDLFFGYHEKFERDVDAVLELAPGFALTRWLYAFWLIERDQPARAQELLDAAPREDIPTIAGQLCQFLKLALEGRGSEAEACVGEELLARAWKVEWWSWITAACFAVIGEDERAIDSLDNARQRGFINYPYLSTHARIFRKLDDNPRFQELLDKVRIAWERFEP